MHHKYILGLSRSPGDRRGAQRTGGSKGREGHVKWIHKDDHVLTKIVGKRAYSTFKEYLETEGLDKCLPGIETIEDGVGVYYKYYTPEDEAKYGVLAIELEKI